VNGRTFDAQVVLTPKNSPRGQLMQKFVLARIVAMNGIDIGLFDYDRHNALYFFILNADEQKKTSFDLASLIEQGDLKDVRE
jgi:hypothetical protein